MGQQNHQISKAIEHLQANLSDIASVAEWASLMGYDHPKKFTRFFLRHYQVRPKRMLDYVKLKSIIHQLRKGRYSNFVIARQHGIPDEIVLNKFVKYHIGCSPTRVKNMAEEELKVVLEKFGSNIRQQKNQVISGS